MQEKTVTVIIADDHDVVRRGIRSILQSADDITVIGEASDGLEAIQMLNRFEPDVLLVDLRMPKHSGMQVMRDARVISPSTRVVVLSIHSEPSYIVQALHEGATGYVLKEAPSTEIVEAVRHAAEGKQYLSSGISTHDLDEYEQRLRSTEAARELSPREEEILRLVCGGLTSTEIAERLGISGRTVESHRANLMRKLGAKRASDLVAIAMSRGLIQS
ncbi:MAG TPA: response regulator transcription factor [Thermoanaerobaculia bacterium]|nr:response regulator transcription factor [Thermoanaerobaculia bacterium]